jgi:hypothetical protein
MLVQIPEDELALLLEEYSSSDRRMIQRLLQIPIENFPQNVERLHWNYVQRLIPNRSTMEIFDVYTGITYTMRSLANGNHADVEPINAEHNALHLQTFNGVHTWTGRPVWVTIGERTFAAAIHSMPHDVSTIPDNGMNGHVCLHFYGSTNNGTNRPFYRDTIEESVRLSELLYNVLLGRIFIEVEEPIISPCIRVNGEFVYIPYGEQLPIIVDGRTLVPLRAVMEALGFEVFWDENSRQVLFVMQRIIVAMPIDDEYMYVNGRAIPLDVSPQIINNRTMIPIRAVSEATEMIVDWDGENLIIDITR